MRTLSLDQASATLRRVFFMLFDAPAGATPQTGKAGTLTGYVTKNGAAAAGVAGTFTEVDNTNMQGLYYYEATAAELDTVGRLVFEFTCAACLTRSIVTQVHETRTGSSAVTITVTNVVGGAPLADILVRVTNAAETVTYIQDTTSATGVVAFLLSDGTYKVFCSQIGSFTFANPYALVVVGTTALGITGTAFSPTAPGAPTTCTVYGWELDALGNAKSVSVKAEVVGNKNFLATNPHIIREAETATSAVADGYWELSLTRSAQFVDTTVQYKFTIDGVDIGAYVVPNSASVALKTLAVG